MALNMQSSDADIVCQVVFQVSMRVLIDHR
jgi:hypothetical protein